ncbi:MULTISPECIES: SAM-dependent methyltransferase [unclassified Streptomyces]|uniref:SAM-dependent methyltransferase n=1 Tax=unclassified Streptomyces TaxID=2593676 RepID=UPI002DD8BAC7|nr:methyltransferase domain-containing protein [Streptomyces sp. NBC_01237]WRZ75230.1 methyltransferase domain-containing protein [Streptomyces sp. NBC_01237]
MSQYAAKSADEVGEYFDDRNWLYELFGTAAFNLHIGWFDGGDEETEPKDRLIDVLAEACGLGEGDRMLDVGCGFGRPAVRAAQISGAHVTGINISAKQVEQATTLAAEAGLSDRVVFQQADGMNLPYPDNSFEHVWAVESVMYMSDREQALREIQRVLVPGGTFVLSDYVERTELSAEQRTALKEGFTVDALPTAEEYRTMLGTAGLSVERFEDATGQLRISAARIPQQLEKNAPVIAEKAGQEYADEFKAMVTRVGVLERDVLGYLIAVARNPKA